MTRKIIHIDMDAFYASVEVRDEPRLRDRPVVVGGSPEGRGVVAAASYEARRYGIHSAMPAARARRLCPEAVFLRPRFDHYRAESRRIQLIFRRYTPLVEPLSLDEAYLDVTDCTAEGGSATRLAQRIKAEIRQQTGLVALPVGRFHGVGPATEAHMGRLGIRTGADLAGWSLEALQQHFGKRGPFYHAIARGIDERPVQPARARKSVGSETTFGRDLEQLDDMLAALRPLAEEVLTNLARRRLAADTVTLKVKYHDFRLVTRSLTRPGAAEDIDQVMETLSALLARTEAGRRPVRLLGVTASGLRPATETVDQLGFGW